MLTTRELQDEIIRLKKEKDICILAHAYQSHDIWEVADYVGDSYGLSVQAAKAAQSTVLMCGVRFMAETVKILSPQKRVLLSNSNAGCPMAEQMDVELISGVKKMYPDYTVVAYINTTSELKTICDVCVTSSSAVQIVKNIENKNILFIPDCNLGKWVADQVPEKNIKLMQGALTAAFITANPGQPLEAAAAAVCAMGLAGEIAHARLTPLDGNATYRNYIIDAIYNMTPAQLEEGAKYEVC